MTMRRSSQRSSKSGGAEPAAAGSARIPGRSSVLARLEPHLFYLPALVIYALFMVVPVAGTVGLSLVHWDGWGAPSFAGLANYVAAFRDPLFWQALWHNLVLIPYYVVLPLAIGLVLAAVIEQLKLRGTGFFRFTLFLPYIMPGVLVGVVWRWLLNPVFGLVNEVLALFGVAGPAWLGDFKLALPTVGLIGAWAGYGFCFVVFLAGIQKIPAELYEAARIDGASAVGEFWHVTVPGLRGEMVVVLVANMINALRAFDVIWATTRGGPGRQTTVIASYMVENAFNINRVGYGAALAVILAVVTIALSTATLRLLGERK